MSTYLYICTASPLLAWNLFVLNHFTRDHKNSVQSGEFICSNSKILYQNVCMYYYFLIGSCEKNLVSHQQDRHDSDLLNELESLELKGNIKIDESAGSTKCMI